MLPHDLNSEYSKLYRNKLKHNSVRASTRKLARMALVLLQTEKVSFVLVAVKWGTCKYD